MPNVVLATQLNLHYPSIICAVESLGGYVVNRYSLVSDQEVIARINPGFVYNVKVQLEALGFMVSCCTSGMQTSFIFTGYMY